MGTDAHSTLNSDDELSDKDIIFCHETRARLLHVKTTWNFDKGSNFEKYHLSK